MSLLRIFFHTKKSCLKFTVLIIIFMTLIPTGSIVAQDIQHSDAYYIIQEDDSLWDIASRFGVALEELEKVNNISNPDQISAGTRLIIPGFEGINGRLETQTVPFGETLQSLSHRYQLSTDLLIRLNHITSPDALYAGATVIVLADRQDTPISKRIMLKSGQSLLELSVIANANPWEVVFVNELSGGWAVLPEDILYLRGAEKAGPGALPEAITEVSFEPLNLAQGKTVLITVIGPPGLILNGSLAGRDLRFFTDNSGYVALQGVHALTEPGLYPLTLKGKLPQNSPYNGQEFVLTQSILIRSGNYPYDPVLQVDPKTIDPEITEPEDELWSKLGAPVTLEKMWNGLFESPVPDQFKDCWTSLFGNRRAYNGGSYDYFHGGLDFCGRDGTELYASAAGKVVFTGSLTVRGNVTVIDHGWGVYTAYDHQSQIDVKVGDMVKPGQLIGLGGATGRTTGPHLHWEVWVGGVQVDPTEWLKKVYP